MISNKSLQQVPPTRPSNGPFTILKHFSALEAPTVTPPRLKGLIGHSATRAGGRSVYLCSALEDAGDGDVGDDSRGAMVGWKWLCAKP